MNCIVLASKSKARQKIFKQLGLKYTICPSNAREKHTLANGPSKLVVSNSLLKANDIAKIVFVLVIGTAIKLGNLN